MRGQLADVPHHAESGCAQQRHRIVDGLLPAPENRDTRTFGDEGLGGREADAAVAAGDDGGPS
ncbi:hypothetical protein D3C72_2252530 [compost metagenome]